MAQVSINMKLDKNYFKVIQITDTHLFKDRESKIFGLSSNDNFDVVMDKIKYSELADADAIFLTGDLSQDETVESYSHLSKQLQEVEKPIYWIPGNHDSLVTMESVFEKSNNFQRGMILSTSCWDFIFINTKIDGRESGYIASSELKRLFSELSLVRGKKIAIIMHHHPSAVNTPLVDGYILENQKEFWQVLENFNIDLIICGHVHNDYTLIFNNTSIETSPATCLQWQKGVSDFIFERKIGYKVYYFWENAYEAKAKMFNI